MFQKHFFAVEAHFDYSLTLTFAVPVSALQHLIPPCLSLDTLDDKRAFIAVAMVQTKGLRPKGFPPCFGNDFFLIGYRIFVRYTNNAGRRWRGLYILKSETDSMKMKLGGNVFTHYNFSKINIKHSTANLLKTIESDKGFKVVYSFDTDNVSLPASSPFKDFKSARRFSGPLPFTFAYEASEKKVGIVEGIRENWIPQPVTIHSFEIPFLASLGLNDAVLANAFMVRDINYCWKKGRTETWLI